MEEELVRHVMPNAVATSRRLRESSLGMPRQTRQYRLKKLGMRVEE